jgi:hypothetical protein
MRMSLSSDIWSKGYVGCSWVVAWAVLLGCCWAAAWAVRPGEAGKPPLLSFFSLFFSVL